MSNIRFGEYTARLLTAKRDKNGVCLETYAVDRSDTPGAALFQAELFKGRTQERWTSWEGPNWRHRAILRDLEAARNAAGPHCGN